MSPDSTGRRASTETHRSREEIRRFVLEILEVASDVVWLARPDGELLYVSKAVEHIYGYAASDFYSDRRRWIDVIHPDDVARVLDGARRIYELGRIEQEYRIIRPDGEERWILERRGIVTSDESQQARVMGVATDITQPKFAEAQWKKGQTALAETVSLLQATLESTADGLLVVDSDGRIARFNTKFQEMWKLPQEIVDTGDDDQAIQFVLDQLADPRGFVEKVTHLYAHPEEESFDVLNFKDGRVFERYSTAQRIDGEVVGRVWSFRDITKRTQAEAQLMQAQKMESIGRLAGGIAHDFNNLLVPILGNAQLLLEDLEAEDERRVSVNEIATAARRAADLTRQILALSRKQMLEIRVLDINEVVGQLHGIIERLISESVAVTTQLEASPCAVEADRNQIEQVVMNLAVNALDAMPDGGALTVQTGNETVDDGELPDLAAGDYVVLTVTDTGHGMDEQVYKHAFEPFFTTKAAGKGTGLGLAIVHGIARQHGGTATVDSSVGEGATFRIYLPGACRPLGSTVEPVLESGRSASTGETVLVVEDSASVLNMAVRILEMNGYQVLAASSPDEAIRIAERTGGSIDLLLTDVIMPGMNGRQLRTRIASLVPGIRVMYMSGYADSVADDPEIASGGVHFIQKPFSLRGLAIKVRQALDAAE